MRANGGRLGGELAACQAPRKGARREGCEVPGVLRGNQVKKRARSRSKSGRAVLYVAFGPLRLVRRWRKRSLKLLVPVFSRPEVWPRAAGEENPFPVRALGPLSRSAAGAVHLSGISHPYAHRTLPAAAMQSWPGNDGTKFAVKNWSALPGRRAYDRERYAPLYLERSQAFMRGFLGKAVRYLWRTADISSFKHRRRILKACPRDALRRYALAKPWF